MSSDIAISVRNVTKTYYIYEKPIDRLKQIIQGSRKKYYKEFHALNNVSFDVPRGASVGIIGRNGSGKSTLLQIIAGTLAPTSGEIEIRGRVAALLELGSGFNPEFTGRENVFLYGSIFGISKEEMEQRFAEIEQFADIGDFIDQPVKNYSSGMFVRLAFSVVVNVDADILIIDEALSVGDMFFQAKCFEKLNQLKNKGVTLLFVSHSMETVKALCSKCVLLKSGNLIFEGDPMRAADYFSKVSLSKSTEKTMYVESVHNSVHNREITKSLLQPPFEKRIGERFGNGDAQYIDAYITTQDGQEVDCVYHGEICRVVAFIQFHKDCEMDSEFGIVVRSQEGIDIYALNSFFKGVVLPPQKAGTIIQVEFIHRMSLAPGIYNIALGLRTPVQGPYNDKVFNAVVFRVVPNVGQTYVPGLIDVPGEVTFKELVVS